MKKIIKEKQIIIVIVLASIVLGGFYYISQIGKRKESEKQQQFNNATNNELTRLNFILEKQDADRLSESFLTAIDKYPKEACSSIISSETTRGHAYYLFLDTLTGLESKYDKYKITIPYISTQLDSLHSYISLAKDWCKAEGYLIP